MTETPASLPQRHLLIAGTGRAGTSFLVEYLSGFGLDTTRTRARAGAFWDADANAGLEEVPFMGKLDGLPYVLKTPWLFQFIDQLLARPDVRVDGVIIPVRDLVEAASSRIANELRSIQRNVPWLLESDRAWEVWGGATGGALYSLNPLDQARILAMGFHQLVERLVRADIPMFVVAVPRLATDSDYLFSHLQSLLPAGTTVQSAREVHARLADPAKLRMGRELRDTDAGSPAMGGTLAKFPDGERLDNIALRREILALRASLEGVGELRDNLHAANLGLQAANVALAQARREREAAIVARDNAVSLMEERIDTMTIETTELRGVASGLEAKLNRIVSSRLFRLTLPLRQVWAKLRAPDGPGIG